MKILIVYKDNRGTEIVRGIESIHELPNSVMFITALKAVRVIDKSDTSSITVSFRD